MALARSLVLLWAFFFAILGQTRSDTVLLEHLSVSGGSDGLVQGILFLGQLSIHHADATLRNVTITAGTGDDGLNVRESTVTISESTFHDNRVDQVDLDFAHGLIEKSVFVSRAANPDGDGLDLSGTTITLRDNVFRGNPVCL